MKFAVLLSVILTSSILSAADAPAPGAAETPEAINARGFAAHQVRNLGEASKHYKKLLALEPPAEPTPAQRELAQKFAPRLFNVATEFFPLKDIVAIVHSDRPVIGYHLFWEDDIGYPSDNEPCDHEIVWVEYDPARGEVTKISTYFHGRLLGGAEAVADAMAHGGRPWIGVEWGFHGSISVGGLAEAEPTLRRHWELAHVQAKNLPRDPLARGWPREYAGDFDAYRAFSEPLDTASELDKRGLVYVSRWPTATLNRWCLRYNFAAKPEWPWLVKPEAVKP